jgi:tetratricopeptide (TPR) repeat protein
MSAEDERLLLQKAAEQGDAKAQYELGSMYLHGKGVPQDTNKAIEWFGKAIEQGDTWTLAVLKGAAKTENSGAQIIFEKAAEQGKAWAQREWAILYLTGQGKPQNPAKAAEWFRKAAEQGDANAQYYLGLLYLEGGGVPEDHAKAAELVRKAAAQGYKMAKDFLATDARIKRAVEKATAEEIRIKAEQGDANAQYELGRLYFSGKGVSQDNDKAIEWFEKAVAQGHVEAKQAKEEALKKKAKEKKRKIGRIIAPVLAAIPIIIFLLAFSSEDVTMAIIMAIFISIPFLVLYFSGSDRKILRGIFLCVGIFIGVTMVIFALNTADHVISIVSGMCISLASNITALIFPME